MRMATSRDQHDMVDLLEIYHARSMRNHLMRELTRLDCDDSLPPVTTRRGARKSASSTKRC